MSYGIIKHNWQPGNVNSSGALCVLWEEILGSTEKFNRLLKGFGFIAG